MVTRIRSGMKSPGRLAMASLVVSLTVLLLPKTNGYQTLMTFPARQTYRKSTQLQFVQQAIKNERQFSPLFQSSASESQPLGNFSWRRNSLSEALKQVSFDASVLLRQARSKLQRFGWLLPLSLALVPVYTAVFHGATAKMPSWWSVVNFEYLKSHPYASLIVAVFLGSNVSYLLSGLYLLAWYRPKNIERSEISYSYPMLGTLILLSGTVSAIFHSVQALGSHALAEALCYVDHGVAISSIFYFWYKCGRPSPRTGALSVAGLLMLIFTEPHYPILHSLWHVFSAAAAVVWARDGLNARISK